MKKIVCDVVDMHGKAISTRPFAVRPKAGEFVKVGQNGIDIARIYAVTHMLIQGEPRIEVVIGVDIEQAAKDRAS